MKNIIFLIVAVLISVNISGQVNLENGLVAHYIFTGNANDVSGNGNDGFLNGDVSIIDGKACFDGTNGYIDCGNDATLNITGSLTISACVITTLNTVGHIVSKVKYASGDWDDDPYDLMIRSDGIIMFNITNGFSDPQLFSTFPINDGVSHHIIALFNSAEGVIKLYIDGVFNNEMPAPSSIVNGLTLPLYLGAAWQQGGGVEGFYEGCMDKVRIYNRAINNEEIIALHDEDTPCPIELSSFTSTQTQSNFVNLQWITQSESNLLGYNVYRNLSDNMETAYCLTNSHIPAHNTTTEQNYFFIDEEVEMEQTYYYWLESVELDGTSEYFGSLLVTVTSEQGSEYPQTTELHSAFPNPFNPAKQTYSTIQFSLKENEIADLIIYNTKGQIVKNYPQFEAGNHSIEWDGKDNQNKNVGSGLYFYQLQSESFSQIRKMVVIK